MPPIRSPIRFYRRHAFTLIEILFVMVLIALFVAAALPRLAGSAKLFSFHNDLSSLQKVLRYAQYHAIIQERVFKLKLNQGEKSYQLFRQSDPEDFKSFEPERIGSRTLHKLDADTEFVGGRSEFYFFPDGTMTYPFRILLQSVHGARVEITNIGLGLFRMTWQRE